MQKLSSRWVGLMTLFYAGLAVPVQAWQCVIDDFPGNGSLTWENVPPDYVGFVQHVPALGGTDVWSSVALSLAGATATVDCASAGRGFFRVAPCAATNIAFYPLLSDTNDASGNLDPMELVNTPFLNGGIYCDGQYATTSANTPTLTGLDFSGVLISAEFMVTNAAQSSPVFVGGNNWRWGGFYVRSDGTVGMLYNDTPSNSTTLPYTTNQWHHAVFLYTETNQTFEIYLDGRLADRRQVAINPHDDRTLSVSHYGSGNTFNGYLRNLRIYNLKP